MTGFRTPIQVYNYAPKAYQSWACAQTYGSGFPGGSVVKNLPANAGDTGSISDPGRSPGEGNGNPLQYSCLENLRDGGAWWATVHGVAKSQTRLRDFTFTFTFMHWRRKWQPTPVFLLGESQGWGSLVGCRL